MNQEIVELVIPDLQQDLKEFATYLGIDYEDYLEHLHPDVDFDDCSK